MFADVWRSPVDSRSGFFGIETNDRTTLQFATTGGQINGGPVTFFVDGKQHVAVAAGNGLFVFAL